MNELRWILRLARPLWRQLGLAALLGLATVASGLGLLATAAYLIAAAALQPSIAELQVAIVGVRFLGISRGVLRYGERYVSHDVTFKLLSQIRVWFYRKLEPLAPAALGFHGSGELLARLIDDIETLQYFYLRSLQPPLVATFGILILLAILIPINGLLAALWLALLVAAGLAFPLLANRASKSIHAEMLDQRAELKQRIIELIQGVADFLACDGASWQRERLNELDDKLITNQRRLDQLDALVQAGLSGATQLAPVVVLWLMVPAVADGAMSGVGLAVLVVAALASFELVTPLIPAVPAFESSLAAARRLLSIAMTNPPIAEPSAPPADVTLATNDLVISGLDFNYKQSQLPALKEINLSVAAGSRLALVGPSGAGKSSLLNLLLRFWDYQQGSIKLGGQDLQQMPDQLARSYFSVLSQRTTLFSGSLRQNLLLAKPAATTEELINSLTLAGARGLLNILPKGLDTEIGEWGWQLSAGQRRRVALARTLLQDRPYLLLDEPTANLDPAAAATILADVLSACRGKTVIMITHQLYGLEAFEDIVVLDQGRICQRGSYENLIKQPGLFRELWLLQVERWQMELQLATAAAD